MSPPLASIPRSFEARAECRRGWMPPDLGDIKIEVIERIHEDLRLRFTAAGKTVGQARHKVRVAVDAPAFRRQCEVGTLKSAPAKRPVSP